MAEKDSNPKPNIFTGSQLDAKESFVLAIHGGAGIMERRGSTPEQRAKYRIALTDALKAGYQVLKLGGEAMDAGIAAVTVLEDCPLFNAGKGAVFNIAGKNELEASLMLSKPPAAHPAMPSSRRGVSAALLTRTKNPSHLVRALYLAPDLVPHALLTGETAESIGADRYGVQTVESSYFWTAHRWQQHRTGLGLPTTSDTASEETAVGSETDRSGTEPVDLAPMGTVGAVALDARGCIAVVTSTGGKTNKLVGRVGDTPAMGAGFWAEEWRRKRGFWDWVLNRPAHAGVGVSGTGDGDFFIRQNVAVTIARRMQYLDEPLDEAAQQVVDDLFKAGGTGGVIAVDRQGNVALPLNCDGMYRGIIRADGVPLTAIFSDDELSQL